MDTENMQNAQVKVIVPRKVKIQLVRVVEHTPFAKKLYNPDMASEVRRAINRWLYTSQ